MQQTWQEVQQFGMNAAQLITHLFEISKHLSRVLSVLFAIRN